MSPQEQLCPARRVHQMKQLSTWTHRQQCEQHSRRKSGALNGGGGGGGGGEAEAVGAACHNANDSEAEPVLSAEETNWSSLMPDLEMI